MKDKKTIQQLINVLDECYPPEKCFLEHTNAWQLLFATILSAQCTDRRVNLVTRELFVKYPDLEAFADAELTELEEDIRSTGFFHNKAKNIKACARMLIDRFNKEVPSDIDLLTSLPGVGRKTANVIRCHIFGIESIVVDTHVKRIAKKLGLTDTLDPVRAEFELMECLPKTSWININQQLITHGRRICVAGRPACGSCPLAQWCDETSLKQKKRLE